MVLFAVIMFFSSFSMLLAKPVKEQKEKQNINYIYILPYIIGIGILTGIIGAGGGFLIIPLLVFFAGLPMKKAVGTSLLIITINSLTGFAGDLQNITVDWMFLLSFTVFSIFGIFVGIYTNKFVNETQLKKGFGVFILVMACFILVKEAFKF